MDNVRSKSQVEKRFAAISSLFTEVVDYAGLFPPAGLSLELALRNYARYQTSPNSWMLGRLVIPASRLPELKEKMPATNKPWRISALVGHDYRSDIDNVIRFNTGNNRKAVVDSVELKAELPDKIEQVQGSVPAGTAVYIEVPLDASLDVLRTIGCSGAYAKARTGGLAPSAIPPVGDLAMFILNCMTVGVAFKATAGLHHPLRCSRPLSYEPDAPFGEMHGFINVLMTCVFALDGASIGILCEILAERDSSSFVLTDSEVRWRESGSTASCWHARERLMRSFGSCSFEEPVQGLSALGWL